MADQALVIGGTGPTGHHIVNGLLNRGYRVAILHTGRHEVDEIPPEVEHIHTDPFDQTALTEALGDRTFELTIATYGRLRRIAELLRDRTGRFLSIGGGPAYRGYMNAAVLEPPGLPVPTAEDAPKALVESEDGKGYRVYRTEEVVFDCHPRATHFRYPYIYGAYQIAPREWCIVRRVLDGRRQLILPDGGLNLTHFGYAENMAHAVLLAVDQPEAAAGQTYNCGDALVLTLRQVVDIVLAVLGANVELISMPYELAIPARPLIGQPWGTHRVFDLGKITRELGYHDVVAPAEGLERTVRWLVANPLEAGGYGERVLQDPFDYQAEDQLIRAWSELRASMPEVTFEREPGYGSSYSGPGGSVRKGAW